MLKHRTSRYRKLYFWNFSFDFYLILIIILLHIPLHIQVFFVTKLCSEVFQVAAELILAVDEKNFTELAQRVCWDVAMCSSQISCQVLVSSVHPQKTSMLLTMSCNVADGVGVGIMSVIDGHSATT